MIKCRLGFVSNSSSSSFIVFFDADKIPTNKDQVKEFLYPNSELDEILEDYEPITVDDVVSQFLYDIQNEEQPSDVELDELLAQGFWTWSNRYQREVGAEEYLSDVGRAFYEKHRLLSDEYERIRFGSYSLPEDSPVRKKIKSIQEQLRELDDQIRADYVTEIRKRFADKTPLVVYYSDNDGKLGSAMEHGDHWYGHENILSVSHH